MRAATFMIDSPLGSHLAAWGAAAAAIYAVFDMGARLTSFNGVRRQAWFAATAIAGGGGLWAMHVTAIAALPVSAKATSLYPIDATLAALAAIAAVAAALYQSAHPALSARGWAGSTALIALASALLFVSGARALGLPVDELRGGLAASAVALTAFGAGALLYLNFWLRRLPPTRRSGARFAAAAGLACILFGAEALGIAALPGPTRAASAAAPNGDWLGLPLAAAAVIAIAVVLLLAYVDAQAVEDDRRQAQVRAEQERLRRLAYYDAATGLPNRSLFNETLLRQLVNVNGRTPPPFGVIYAELESYHQALDELGAERMQRVLQALSEQLGRVLRPGDFLARDSYDGFVFLIREHADRDLATAFAAVCSLLDTPVHSEGEFFKFNWSVGRSRYPDHGNSTRALVRAAMKPHYRIEASTRPARALTAYFMA
jgi:diguanylate cyclase (GGDEF)-like protein